MQSLDKNWMCWKVLCQAVKQRKNKNYIVEADSRANTKWRKVLHTAKDADLDRAVYWWWQYAKGAPVNGPLIKAKVKKLFSDLHAGMEPTECEKQLKPSEGWLRLFVERHVGLYVEALSTDTLTIKPFRQYLMLFVASATNWINRQTFIRQVLVVVRS